jgi:hypothetical protein
MTTRRKAWSLLRNPPGQNQGAGCLANFFAIISRITIQRPVIELKTAAYRSRQLI